MQPKIHQNAADKQRAYRQRLKARLAGLRPEEPARKPKRVSRPERLARVTVEVQDLADGYQSWLDGMPENQAESALAERLQETVDLFQQAIDALEQVEPPRLGALTRHRR